VRTLRMMGLMERGTHHMRSRDRQPSPDIAIDPTDRVSVMTIAARAHADPRTVARLARGERVRGDVVARIVRAAQEIGRSAA
jgi:hypothetical protein